MGQLYYIMGKSASGKDTMYQSLLEEESIKLLPVVLHTTRPMREGEKQGREYWFVEEDELKALRNKNQIIEEREYQTTRGIWRYATTWDSIGQIKRKNYLAVGTLESYEKLKDGLGEERIVPIYLEVDDGIRLQRAINRELKEKNPNYAEVCRRYLTDDADFSEEAIRRQGIDKKFDNRSFPECLQEIIEYIHQQIAKEVVITKEYL